MSFFRTIRSNKSLTVILVTFGVIYGLISLVNHYYFRTYALDLGLFNNSVWDYAHFRSNQYSLQRDFCANPLADHFDLTPVLASPFYWIFGSYTMLVVQICAVLFGGYGVFYYFRKRTQMKFLPEIAALHFLLIFGIFSAISFDYHGSVVGAMFVPWFIHYFELSKPKKYLVYFGLILISREHMALFAAFICLGLVLSSSCNSGQKRIAGVLGFSALIYFLIIVKWVMPALDDDMHWVDGFRHFRYGILGNSPLEAIKSIFRQPVSVVRWFFENHTEEPFYNGIKWELHRMLLLSGGFVFLRFPRFFIMLIPIFFQKVYADDVVKWGINYHYSIEFAPVLSLALFTWFSRWKSEMLTFLCSGLATILAFFATYSSFQERKSIWFDPVPVAFYLPEHYEVNFNAGKLHKKLKEIPLEVGVSASSPLVPHLSNRKLILSYPEVDEASLIVLLDAGNTYPMQEAAWRDSVACIAESPDWKKEYDENRTLIFRRVR